MKIGISSPAFAFQPFLQILESVASEFQLWEIVADLNQLLPDIAQEFLENTPSYDMEFSVHAPFNDLNLAALNPKLRGIAVEYIKDTIAIANDLGISLISLHPGHLSPTGVYYREDVNKANLRSLNEIAEFAADYDIKLGLENMPLKHWTLGNTRQELATMIDGTRLGVCFDIGHAFINNEVDEFLKDCVSIYNVHFHDNHARRDEHLVLGEGDIDITHILRSLRGKYTGNIIIESNTLSEGVKSRDYLAELMQKIGL